MFAKKSILDIHWVLNAPLGSEYINNTFHQMYLSDKSDIENGLNESYWLNVIL